MAIRKNKIKEIDYLKSLIREILLQEGGPAMASGIDPTNPQGFYSYELSRGSVDNFWYRSPGRSMGSDGDPGRPSDASAYIGLTLAAEPAIDLDAETSDLIGDDEIKVT